MKKIVLFLAAAVSFSFAQAQNGPRLGLKAGTIYSNISGDLDNQNIYDNKFGFVGGVTANFPISADGFLSIQPELLYSQKGYKYTDQTFMVNNMSTQRKGYVNYNYLDLPVMLRVNAGGLYFEGGPQVSYLLGIRDKTEQSNAGGTFESRSVVDKGNLSPFEVGYAAGLGYQLRGLSLGIRYNGSINSLAKGDSGASNDNLTNARHSTFMATVGIAMPGTR